MKQTKEKLDSLDYLLGGVGLLALLFFSLPSLIAVPTIIGRVVLSLLLLVGSYGLWRVLHRFTEVNERVVAVICVVAGWYLMIGLLMILNSLWAFRNL